MAIPVALTAVKNTAAITTGVTIICSSIPNLNHSQFAGLRIDGATSAGTINTALTPISHAHQVPAIRQLTRAIKPMTHAIVMPNERSEESRTSLSRFILNAYREGRDLLRCVNRHNSTASCPSTPEKARRGSSSRRA